MEEFQPIRTPTGAQVELGDLTVEIEGARIDRGTIHGSLGIRRGDSLLYRDTVNLTSRRSCAQLLQTLADRGISISDTALLALDQACRSPAPGFDVQAPPLTGAQSFFDGTLILSLRYGSQIVYATSAGEVLDAGAARRRFDLTTAPDVEARLSRVALQRFKDGTAALTPRQLFEDVAALFRDHLDWPEPYCPTLLAIWAMATYVYRIFTYFPYLAFSSVTKRSGKSLAEEILSEIAFNATPVLANPTAASVFRDVHYNSSTVILDEVEHLREGDKDCRDLLAVLNVGFKHDATVPRVESVGDRFQVVRYSAYSPKALASVRDLADTVRDRAIPIRMKRKKPGVRLQRFNVRSLRPLLEHTRDRCHLFALLHAADIAKLYAAAEELPLPDGLDDRARDILEPLFAVGGVIDALDGTARITTELVAAARGIGQLRNQAEHDSENIVVAVWALASLFADEPQDAHVLRSDDAVLIFRNAGLGWVTEPKHAQALLRRLGFYSGSHRIHGETDPIRGYKVMWEAIEDLKARYPAQEEKQDATRSAGPDTNGSQPPAP